MILKYLRYQTDSLEYNCNCFFLGTVADICRYLRNFNGVLQIMAAFVNSSIYRLKQTWDRISKQNKQVINKLQNLVHSDGKFKNLRDTLTK
jgi:Ras-specific guanine nucleotide-releasing factor 1